MTGAQDAMPAADWRELGEDRLLERLRETGDEIDEGVAEAILANPHAGRRVIEELLRRRALLASYRLKKTLAGHPATPQPRAMNLVAHLYWRDLARLGADARARPAVRRQADRRLAEKLARLTVGERIALARVAGVGVLKRLVIDPSPRVIDSLLENPRLTETVLGPLIHDEGSSPASLERVAASPKWGRRYSVRAALARNPATPPELALDLLSSLQKRDLREVGANVRVAPAVRRRAGLLLGVHPSRLAGKRI